MDTVVLESRDGGVATLTLSDPDRRNALSNQAQWDAVVAAVQRVGRDPDVRCVILTGAGSAFCASGNVKDMKDKTGIAAGLPYAIREGYRAGIQRIPVALYQLDVPTIAAVNGPAIGAGCDLACMCGIRIASNRAKFAESFVKLGIITGDLAARAVGRVPGAGTPYARARHRYRRLPCLDEQVSLCAAPRQGAANGFA
jgi:enoyl-CoA hydratase/carnithine racemase